MRTGGLTFMLVRTMLKLSGSEETEDQLMVLSTLRSRLDISAGAVTWRAKVEATRARKAGTQRVSCMFGVWSGLVLRLVDWKGWKSIGYLEDDDMEICSVNE